MKLRSTNCCGMVELHDLDNHSTGQRDWMGTSSKKQLKEAMLKQIDKARRTNKAVIIATTVHYQRLSANLLSELGFFKAEDRAKREKQGNNITLWTRAVNLFTKEEDEG